MCLFKSFVGNNFMKMIRLFLLLPFFLYHIVVTAQECSSYMVSSNTPSSSSSSSVNSVVSSSSSIPKEYSNITIAISQSHSGDVICFREGIYSSLIIKDVKGGKSGITLKPVPGDKVKILNTNFRGSGVYIENSINITIRDLNISGGLYGIYAIGSSALTIANNHIHDIGQEGITIKSGWAKQPLKSFTITNNIISDTGKSNAQYGEGIYIGDGNEDYNETLNNIEIINNRISNTSNEAIDIKVNTRDVIVKSNTVVNTNLAFNGAITVATAGRIGDDINISILNNTIKQVANRSGYRPIGIAIGQGTALIEGNFIVESNVHFIGVCLFTTFVNKGSNKVKVGDNEIITNGKKTSEQCSDGGTGLNSPATVMY